MRNSAPEAYAIDLDETVYQTNLAFAKMARIAVAHGLAAADSITRARAAVEKTRGSFDLLGHLAATGVAADELDELQSTFAANHEGDELLYPDARPLFTALRDTQTPFYIHTKGGRATQLAKLASCGLDQWPYRITDSTFKGKEIAAMSVLGGYAMPVQVGPEGASELLHARSVYLLEDKPDGFRGLPEDCGGALVRRRSANAFQQGAMPARIHTVANLAPITERIYQLAALSRQH